MKLSILFFILFFFGQSVSAQELSCKTQRKLRKTLRVMLKDDQEYRLMLNAEASISQDSIKLLIEQTDHVNRLKFVGIMQEFGYPSEERIGSELSAVLTLHFTTEENFFQLHQLFNVSLKKGEMPPVEFARWYDRCQINMHGENAFGAYGKKEFCADEIQRINENRASIGLDALIAVQCD